MRNADIIFMFLYSIYDGVKYATNSFLMFSIVFVFKRYTNDKRF